MWFTNNSLGINHFIQIMPSEAEYIIHVITNFTIQRAPRERYVTKSVFYSENGTKTSLNISYVNDDRESAGLWNRTTNVTMWVKNGNGTLIYWKSWPNFGSTTANQTVNWSFTVDTITGNQYYWGVNASSSYWGFDYQSTAVTLKAAAGRLIDLGFDAVFGVTLANMYYTWISLGFIFSIAGLFGVMHVKNGAVLIPLFAWLFWWIGWYSTPLLGVTVPLATFLGIMVYMRKKEREVYGA
jgi:hypothetical protein